MIYHRIHTYHGSRPDAQQRPIHAYRTLCGAEVLSLHVFSAGQTITVGVLPHVQCARCFSGQQRAEPQERDDGMAHEVRDEKGNLARTEVDESHLGVAASDPAHIHALRVKRTSIEDGTRGRTIDESGLGRLEGSDYE